MSKQKPMYMNIDQCVDHIVKIYGNHITIGMPLGLGKPVPLINALYQRAKKNPQIHLSIFTALSLEKPIPSTDLEKRLMGPFLERNFNGVPDLDYMLDLRTTGVPENIRIHELYTKAGAYKNDARMQQDYMSTNYTHTVRDVSIHDNRVFAQIIAKSETGDRVKYSTSCNADTALETIAKFAQLKKEGFNQLTIGVVNTHLPFMYGDAEVDPEAYDIIIDDPALYHPLFIAPRQPVSIPDFMIGFHVSTLIKDSGTLQIGIGALGDSVAYNLHLRHNENSAYNALVAASGAGEKYPDLIARTGGTGVFEEGLYGSTEMLVDGFLQLYKNGVIKRRVYHHIGIQKLINDGKLTMDIPRDILQMMLDDETLHPYLTQKEFEQLQRFGVLQSDLLYENGQIIGKDRRYSALLADPENLAAISDNCLGKQLKNGVVLTGGFFIGPQDFYDDLNAMPEDERRQFEMTGVDVANQLYGDEVLRRLQRKNGRFCNTGMKATLLGAISSDGLEDGTVISGVGGQYNFVSMAHALEDGRCIMMIKSTRMEKGDALSNIVYNYAYTTIPRHLKDIVVTEYGIADLRGKCDQDVIKEMLNVADSRFQKALLAQAKEAGKIPEDYQIPEAYTHNTPQRLAEILGQFKAQGLFPDFPCGSAFTGEELFIAFSLKTLAAKSLLPEAAAFPDIMKKLPDQIPESLTALFARMGLDNPETEEEKASFKTLMLAFHLAGFC